MDDYARALMEAGLVTRPLGIRPQETNHCVSCDEACTPCLPGNDEADTLAKVRWLETVPPGLSGREVAQWLHRRLLHAGQKTMGSTIKTWGLPVTLAEVQEVCETCAVCSQEHP